MRSNVGALMPSEFVTTNGGSDGASSKHSTLPTSTGLTSHTLGAHSDVNVAGIVANDSLVWDGAQFLPTPPSSIVGVAILDDLSDVNAPTPTTNDLLSWDGADWVNVTLASLGGTSLNLGDLINVTAGSPTSGDVLQWTGAAWVNSTIATLLGGGSLNALSDVTITTPVTTNLLHWNGSAWVNVTPNTVVGNGIASIVLDDIGNVSAPSPTTNDVLQWNGSAWVPYAIPGAGAGTYTGTVATGPSGTSPVLWGSDLYDPDGRHSTSSNTNRITVGSGETIIRIKAFCRAGSMNVPQLTLRKNGAPLALSSGGFDALVDCSALGFSNVVCESSALVVTAGDYFDLVSTIAVTDGWFEMEVLQ